MDIKVDHVSKAYGEQQVLRDLSCVFPEGKTTCIRGRSGCGKTTLIRLLLRLSLIHISVAFFLTSIIAAGLPTTRLLPITTAFLPVQSIP